MCLYYIIYIVITLRTCLCIIISRNQRGGPADTIEACVVSAGSSLAMCRKLPSSMNAGHVKCTSRTQTCGLLINKTPNSRGWGGGLLMKSLHGSLLSTTNSWADSGGHRVDPHILRFWQVLRGSERGPKKGPGTHDPCRSCRDNPLSIPIHQLLRPPPLWSICRSSSWSSGDDLIGDPSMSDLWQRGACEAKHDSHDRKPSPTSFFSCHTSRLGNSGGYQGYPLLPF